jgi:hypothetical protein
MRIQIWNERVDPAPGTIKGKEGWGVVMERRRSAGRRSFIRENAWQGINQGESSKPGATMYMNITETGGMHVVLLWF